jgi:hypothetical protein
VGTDEALYKLSLDAYISWPLLPSGMLGHRIARHRVHIFLVYEVLFHQPVELRKYVLRSVHIVLASDRILQPKRQEEMKALIIKEFVNRWISEVGLQVHEQSDNTDGHASLSPR